jgi:hypothetical protein
MISLYAFSSTAAILDLASIWDKEQNMEGITGFTLAEHKPTIFIEGIFLG